MVAGLFLSGVILWYITSRVFDRLIEYQHNYHKDAWEYDGKPRGMFFNPIGGSYISFNLVCWRLFRRTEVPRWAVGDSTALKLYKNVELWNKMNKYFYIAFFPLLIVGKSLGY